MPKLCMTRTVNLSNTQLRYQLVFFGCLKVAFGICCPGKTCHPHLLPRQNKPRLYVLLDGMMCLIQRHATHKTNFGLGPVPTERESAFAGALTLNLLTIDFSGDAPAKIGTDPIRIFTLP